MEKRRQDLRNAISERKSHDELHRFYENLSKAQNLFDNECSESIRYNAVLDSLYERANDLEIDLELLPEREEEGVTEEK